MILPISGYEYDNIQNKLDRMTQPELESNYAQKLMDRAAQIRDDWRNGRGAYSDPGNGQATG